MAVEIPLQVDLDHRRMTVGGEPLVFHCHHYNTFLQRTILDAEGVDAPPFLIGAAAECSHSQLTKAFAELSLSEVEARKALAADIYRWSGFGTLDLAPLGPEGGATETPNGHYGMGWKVKWGLSETPVDFFTTGWLAGALAAIYDAPLGSYSATQTSCVSQAEGGVSRFELAKGEANYTVFSGEGAGVGLGQLSESHEVREIPASSVDYEGILSAVAGLDLAGDAQGIANAFGVYLTRHFANYYNRVSFELARTLQEAYGDAGRQVAEPLLIEAGHVCAFNTFGGIMSSTEWDALIRPTLKTPEDWVHGMMAVVNAFGWGRWQVTKVSADEAEFVIHDDYESSGYAAMYGQAKHPISWLAQGGAAGVMNLVYVGGIQDKPALTEEFYQRTFGQADVYRATPLTSQAMGDAVTSFRVTRG